MEVDSEGDSEGDDTTLSQVEEQTLSLSDDSSFYGDDKLKSDYTFRSIDFDPSQFWHSQQRSLQWIAEQCREAAEANAARAQHHHDKRKGVQKMDHESQQDRSNPAGAHPDGDAMEISSQSCQKPELYNLYEGDEMAKQLDEPLADFLNRLKPSNTPLSSGPWIWIADPHAERLGRRDLAGLKQEGHRILESFKSQRHDLEASYPEKNPASITKMMKVAKDLLEEDIVKLARAKNLVFGKWMLFPAPSDVDEVWTKVAGATLAGTLGIAAKVATAGDDDRSKESRLICVYTKDFSDKDDVKRVLRKLLDLQLARGGRGIFYKCDAYTYLDIMNGNEYKLRASMYNSKEILKEG